MESLDDAVVERQIAIFEEACQCDLVIGEVADCNAELGSRWLVLLA